MATTSDNQFSGARVLITGGSSGIGAGLAEAFARAGATVGIAARRHDRLAEVVARCRAQVYGVCQKAYTQALKTLDEYRLRRSYLEGLARVSASKRVQALPVPDALSGNPPPAPIEVRPREDGVPQDSPDSMAGLREPGGYAA